MNEEAFLRRWAPLSVALQIKELRQKIAQMFWKNGPKCESQAKSRIDALALRIPHRLVLEQLLVLCEIASGRSKRWVVNRVL